MTLFALAVVAIALLALCWRAFQLRAEEAIVDLLRQHGEASGLQLVMASGGALRRGTVYVHLHRLEEAGRVVSREVDPKRGRRVYRLAEAR